MRNWVTGVMIVLSFLLITCKDKGIEIIDNTLPGRRDYTWTVDTLKANPGDQINLSSLWGSSPSDVWAVGSADASNLAKWHYNGTAWKLDSLRLSSNLSSVFGFAQDNVWACDAPDGNILHYDGKSWMKFGKYSLPGYPFLYLVDIWGASPDDVYCVGAASISGGGSYKGIIMHFDGGRWDFVSIPDRRVEFGWIRRDHVTGKYFLLGTRFEPTGDSVKVFQFDGQNLKEIYANTDGSLFFNLIDRRVYFTDRKRILFYSDTSFTTWQDFSSMNVRLGFLYGRTHKDIVAGGYLNGRHGILHYNGTDLQMLYETSLSVFSMFLLPSDIFILTHDGTYPIVIHGVLK